MIFGGRRTLRHRVYHVLGLIAVFSGLMFVYAGLQIANRQILKRRLRRFHRRLSRGSAGPISKRNFPSSYFRKAIEPGMSTTAVERLVVGGRKSERHDKLFTGSFAYVYHFPFSVIQKHRLVVLFDEDERVVGVDAYQLSVDLL